MLEYVLFNPWIALFLGAAIGWKLRLVPLSLISVPVFAFLVYNVIYPEPELGALVSTAIVIVCALFLMSMWLIAAIVRYRSFAPSLANFKTKLFR